MYLLFKIFIDILLFRSGPQELPASPFLLYMTMVLYFAVGVLVAWLSFPFWSAVSVSCMDTALLISLIWIALWIKKLDYRMLQTLTAALGTLGLITLIVFPLDVLYAITDNMSPESEDSGSLLSTLLFILMAWSLTVLGHILRNALEIRPALAVGLSLLYLTFSFILTVVLFTVPVSE